MKKMVFRLKLLTAFILVTAGIAFAIEPAMKMPASAMGKPDGNRAGQKSAVEAPNAKPALKSKIIDINTASEAELKSIPGIGSAYASKIIAARPYANKAQLKSRNVLPVPAYEQVKELIIARQPIKEAAEKKK